MITLKQLKFSNAFSYGENNAIDFTRSPLTQLVGKNGHGKSSVALILEEVLFNKNSKGTKKGDILNRYITDKSYFISLYFDKDGVPYLIETKRGATQTVKLYRDGADISSHTATATYKQIEQIIGMDHKTFSQIVYQSHAGSLEFLTAPDTARKKFLIELLGLSRYTEAGEVFKSVHAEVNKEFLVAQSKVDTIVQWIKKYETVDTKPQEILPVPELPDSGELAKLTEKLSNIEQTNKRINQNNTYKSLEAKAKAALLPMPDKPTEEEEPYIKAMSKASTERNAAAAFIDKMSVLHGTCPTCLSSIDEEKVSALIEEYRVKVSEADNEENLAASKAKAIKAAKAQWLAAKKAQEDWEKYHQLIDPTLPEEFDVVSDLSDKIDELQSLITTTKAKINKIEQHNKSAIAHNSKLAVIEGQVAEMNVELEEWSGKLHALSSKLNTLSVLLKVFSTTGLVAYKIENLVKDLEDLTNVYLGELSGGRFQIAFQISGSDKLNVVVTDNGLDIDISALSGGERARVNVAALLAIRKLMQSLSQSRINLLILDETVEALDVDGKEKLVEVLLGEESLNTILVSHGFTHPLLEKIHVVKHNNISRIET